MIGLAQMYMFKLIEFSPKDLRRTVKTQVKKIWNAHGYERYLEA